MSRFKRIVAVVALVAGGAVGTAAAPSPAGADPFEAGYCPVTDLSGAIAYDARVTAIPAPRSFVMDVWCEAPFLPGHNSGSYSLTLEGQSDETSCAATFRDPGTGSGTVTGAGPEGPIEGTFSFAFVGDHVFVGGEYASDSKPHVFSLTVRQVNHNPAPCDFQFADLVGQAVFEDTTPPDTSPPPQGAFEVLGNATITPGYALVGTHFTWTFAGTFTGEFNGVPGTCDARFTGSGLGSLISETGTGAGGCRGTTSLNTPIEFTCTFSYTRSFAIVSVSGGTCTGTQAGSLTAELALRATSANPVTSATVHGWATIL